MSPSDGTDALQHRLAERVLTLEPLADTATLERALDGMVDWFGVAIASAPSPIVGELDAAARTAAGRGVVGSVAAFPSGRCHEAVWAARINGAAGHAQDFDDTHASSLVHVSSSVLPALLSALARNDVDGREFLAAYVAGVWTCEVLAPGAGERLLRAGLHPTATLGAVASAAATARLLGIDHTRTAVALGLAASSAYGTLANFGTMAKPLQAGNAAANGLLAALLAEQGITAGGWGGRGHTTAGPVLGTLLADEVRSLVGCRLADEDTRRSASALRDLAFKPYAACLLTHAAIDAAVELSATLPDAGADAVRSATVRVSEETVAAAGIPAPRTGYEAKFSLAYCVATALARGNVPVSAFADRFGEDRAVMALLQRVTVEAVEGQRSFEVELSARLDDGMERSAHRDSARGQPAQPLTSSDIDEKFRANVTPTIGGDRAARLLDALRSWPTRGSARACTGAIWELLGPARTTYATKSL